MTLQSMQWHEQVTLRYSPDDYRRTSLIELVEPYVIGRRVLDMRSLTGHLSARLFKKGFEVSALDGYQGAVQMTNTLVRSCGASHDIAEHWDLTGLSKRFPANEFDTVLCLDVLNHVQDDNLTMSEITKVLKPSGRLILTAPAFPSLFGKRDQSLEHLRLYKKSELVHLLEKNGFKIQTIRYWNFLALPFYALIERIMKRRISDSLRYGRSKFFGSILNCLLRWWYQTIENKIHFPVGLSFVLIAERSRN